MHKEKAFTETVPRVLFAPSFLLHDICTFPKLAATGKPNRASLHDYGILFLRNYLLYDLFSHGPWEFILLGAKLLSFTLLSTTLSGRAQLTRRLHTSRWLKPGVTMRLQPKSKVQSL
jgi:hypothetical protein